MRLRLLAPAIAVVTGTLVSGCGSAVTDSAPSPTPTAAATTSILFALEAERGRLPAGPDGAYGLSLKGTDPSMAAFADRPVREAAAVNTAKLPDLWKLGGEQSFTADPPNAAITTHTEDGQMRVLVGTLSEPAYDEAEEVLSMTVTPLEPVTLAQDSTALGATSVLIDGAIPFIGGSLFDGENQAGWTNPPALSSLPTPSSGISFLPDQGNPLTADEIQ